MVFPPMDDFPSLTQPRPPMPGLHEEAVAADTAVPYAAVLPRERLSVKQNTKSRANSVMPCIPPVNKNSPGLCNKKSCASITLTQPFFCVHDPPCIPYGGYTL